MTKLNNYDSPDLSFSEAIKMVKEFHDKLKGTASSFSSLASAFNSSEKSGWFKVKVADLKKYGLIEGRGEFRISDIGKDILFYNKKSEYQEAIKKVLDNIDLFKTIYDRLHKDVQDINTFRAILSDITQADKGLIKDKAEQIRNIYIDLVSNIDEDSPYSNDDGEESSDKDKQQKKRRKLENNMISTNSGEVYIELPKDKRYIKIAVSLLRTLKTQLELEEGETTQNDEGLDSEMKELEK